MFELRVLFVVLLCLPFLLICVKLMLKLVDEFIRNKNK